MVSCLLQRVFVLWSCQVVFCMSLLVRRRRFPPTVKNISCTLFGVRWVAVEFFHFLDRVASVVVCVLLPSHLVVRHLWRSFVILFVVRLQISFQFFYFWVVTSHIRCGCAIGYLYGVVFYPGL